MSDARMGVLLSDESSKQLRALCEKYSVDPFKLMTSAIDAMYNNHHLVRIIEAKQNVRRKQ